MAKKSNNPWRTLVSLIVLVAVGIGSLVVGHYAKGASVVPELALDLQGGTQVILTPKMIEGSESRSVTQDDMNEAINIIRQRIDASGVSEAEISTLGSNNIVVSIPGQADQSTLDLIQSSAIMRFRPVLQIGNPTAADPTDSMSQSGEEPQSTDEILANMSAEEYALALADTDGDGTLSSERTADPEDNSDTAWITEQIYYDFLMLDCTDPESLKGGGNDNPDEPIVACGVNGDAKYILGPTDIEGTHITSASAGMGYSSSGQPTGEYVVDLKLDSEGATQFADVSERLFALQTTDATRNRFAVVLDGNVISAPSMNAAITDGQAQISGSFTAQSAKDLANQLSFGSLPLNFEVQSQQQISATLGTNHLEKGLMAGVVGLILVLLWMIWQYRGLSLVSAGSLILAGGITYLAITILSWTMGYRLSLPGVVGLIVAVGITADSFIVYFERIRDEVRDGIPLQAAVEQGWKRARRTILISDAVNLVAAVVLYVLAVGGVQGFAFTLGLTTLIDLLVIFMFTHPLMSLLMRTKFYGQGGKWSGLDPEHLGAKTGAIYAGRGKIQYIPDDDSSGKKNKPSTEGSIADRRRAKNLLDKTSETEKTSLTVSKDSVEIETRDSEQTSAVGHNEAEGDSTK